VGTGVHRGLGQRILTTDNDDVPLMEVRTILLNGAVAGDEHG
jgi:protein involved in temperature-dependent protein secretion